jgi:hypothetical protein
MLLTNILYELAKRLQNAAEKEDRESADELFTVFSILREVSYQGDNRAFTGLLVDFVDAARDVAMGVKAKHPIPSIEAIQAAFSTEPAVSS